MEIAYRHDRDDERTAIYANRIALVARFAPAFDTLVKMRKKKWLGARSDDGERFVRKDLASGAGTVESPNDVV
jgi:hypothetical protein